MKIIGKITPRGPNKTIRNATSNVNNLGPALNSIENLMQSSIEQNFLDEGRPEAWKALSQARIAQRIKIKRWPGPILVVSGQLKSSINTRVEKNVLIVGSNKKYAPLMNASRRFLLFQKEDVKESEQILLEHLLGGLK